MGISGVDMEPCVTEAAGLLGYESLKDEQRDCIIGFLNRRDVFAVLSTKFGKTACFTCLPHAFVSPLTALICDQVEDLQCRNVLAGYIDAESTPEIIKNVADGVYSIVFMSLEQLVDRWRSLFSSRIYKSRIVGLIIDEAHCVVKW